MLAGLGSYEWHFFLMPGRMSRSRGQSINQSQVAFFINFSIDLNCTRTFKFYGCRNNKGFKVMPQHSRPQTQSLLVSMSLINPILSTYKIMNCKTMLCNKQICFHMRNFSFTLSESGFFIWLLRTFRKGKSWNFTLNFL